MRSLPLLPLFSIFVIDPAFCQNTVGLITNDAALSEDGYTLFYPADQHTVYLVDNCGRLVHTWSDEEYTSSHAVYLMDNGDLVRCGRRVNGGGGLVGPGGAGEMVDRRDWDGNLIWRYNYRSETFLMHHDVAMMPNGNVLIVAWEAKTLAEAAQVGMDTAAYELTSIWPDHVIEVQPTGVDEGTIVWEWHAWDHVIQDRDPELPNYGVIAEHPERFDINFHPVNDVDWMHVNSVDHNPELDQIMLTSPFFNEVWVIDHSTTTEEAASHSGGNSGRGGDLLYRWGNPSTYDRGGTEDQTLFFPHHGRWLGPGLPANDPDRGNIIVYNNRFGVFYSVVDLLAPPFEEGEYLIEESQPFGPSSGYRRITSPLVTDMFSSGLSSAQKLFNGNVLVCSGRQGWIFEIDQNDELVWEYIIPLVDGSPVSQGTEIDGPGVFMAYKYPVDHPFLSTQDLTSNAYIELDPNTAFCGSINVAVSGDPRGMSPSIHPNPASTALIVPARPGEAIRISDLIGKTIFVQQANTELTRIDLSGIAAGTYVVHVDGSMGQVLVIEK